MADNINHTPGDPDLVDRIFDYLKQEFPGIAGPALAKAKKAVRDEFKGEGVYIAGRGPAERHEIVTTVLALFNGRNASEIARRLGIGRASVYRIIKQAHQKDRLKFPGNETAAAIRSATSTALQTQPDPSPWPSQVPTSHPSTQLSPAASSPSSTTGEPSPTEA